MTEIGSYFEKSLYSNKSINSELNWLPQEQSDYTFTFSGRSAIELAIVDILKSHNIKRVYMPSYCCYSMLSPFIKHNIDILFYDVTITPIGLNYEINLNENFDLFFSMSYFGVEHTQDELIKLLREKKILIIEDITHRLLSKKNHSPDADYLIASLRKWFPIPSGGVLMKKEGFIDEKPVKSGNEFVFEQIEAMKLKSKYLSNNKSVKKEEFLKKYSVLYQYLPKMDHTYNIDQTSINELYKIPMDKLIARRTENAKLLYDSLSSLNHIKPLIPNFDSATMTPLFVPIVLASAEVRDRLLKKLINKKIYCPVHWPLSDIIANRNKNIDIYDKELSLICDQRYGDVEMQKIIDTLGEFEEDYV